MAGIDANTLLCTHMDGTDASTTFTDSAQTPNTLTAAGDAQIDTAQSKFGGASGLFDGTGDEVSFTPVFSAPGTGAFTFDCWFRSPSISTEQTLISNYTSSASGDQFVIEIFTSKFFLYNGSGSIISGSGSFSSDTWYHVAVVRENNGTNGTKAYIDGTLDCTGTWSGSITANTTWKLGNIASGSRNMNGWIDEARWSNTARWTANFTPPTSAYSLDSTNTNFLAMF